MRVPDRLKYLVTGRGPVIALSLILVWALALFICLWRVETLLPGPVNSAHTQPSPRVADGVRVSQSFHSAAPDLCQVRLLIGTFHSRHHNPTRFELFRLPGPPPDNGPPDLGAARLVHSRTFSRTMDNRARRFNFPPQADSAGAWYLARLTPLKSGLPGSIVAWSGPADLPGGRMYVNGQPRPGALTLAAFHASRLSKTALLLERLARLRPTWFSPAPATAAALAAWLAVIFLIGPGTRTGRLVWLGPPLLLALGWTVWLAGAPPRGLEAEYHQGHRLSYPVFERQNHFRWGEPGRRLELQPQFDPHDIREMELRPDKFAVRHTGRLKVPRAGDYTFEITTGGRTRLSLGGNEILAARRGEARPGVARVTVHLAAGPVDLEMIHHQYGGRAELLVRWGPEGGRLRPLGMTDLLPSGVDPESGWRLIASSVLCWLAVLLALAPLGLRLWREAAVNIRQPRIYLPLALLLVGLLVRLIYVFQAQTSHFGLDAIGYHDLAWDQADYMYLSHGVLKGFWPWLNYQPVASGPIISYLLAGITALLGRDLLFIRLVMSLFGLATAWVIYCLTRRLFGLAAGCLAMTLIIWSGSGLVHEAAPLIAGPMALAMAATAWFCCHLIARGPVIDWLRAGLALGLVILLRGNALLMAPVLGLALMFRHGWRWPTIGRMTLMAGTVVLLLAVPTVWNSGFLGNRLTETALAPSSAGPNTIWIGNNPMSAGHNMIPTGYLADIRAKVAREEASLLGEVADFITGSPLAFARLMWTKTWMFFNGHEYPNNLDYYNLARSTPILGWGMFNYALLCPLALAGLILVPRGKWPAITPLVAMIGGYGLAVIAFFVLGRFRVPLYPVLAVFGGYGLSRLGAGWRKAAVFLALAALLYTACNWDQLFHPLARNPAWTWQYWNLEYGHLLRK